MCDEKWENGLISVDKDVDIDEVVNIRDEHKCMIPKANDGQVFLINTSGMRKLDFLDELPILASRPLMNGYYTWLVYSNTDTPQQFIACKTFSILEIGTLHRTMAFRVNADKIHAAGEIFVQDGQLYYNFYSGTYMLPVFTRAKRTRDCPIDELEDFLMQKMKEILGDDIIWRSKSFMNVTSLPVTNEELQLYRNYGAVVSLFNRPDNCVTERDRPRG